MFGAAFTEGAAPSVSAAPVADRFELSPWGYKQAMRWLEVHHPLVPTQKTVGDTVRLANELFCKDSSMSVETAEQLNTEDNVKAIRETDRQGFIDAVKAKADSVKGLPLEEGQSVQTIVNERVNATVSGILSIIDGKEAVPGYHLIQATDPGQTELLGSGVDISGDLAEAWFDAINT